ncbi:MAG: response regulator transcription factor [Anaerolineales bacterium]|nr:response regulator transcription factor [Anaerolineales bacterium]
MTTHSILIVDDEPSILDLLTYNLEKEHFHVLAASNGAQALQLAAEHRPNLIILDLMLPEIDGLEVCRRLRKEGNIPIIMLTARDEEIDRVVGLELGADDYVVKPFSVRELLARVRTVLRRSSIPKPDHTDILTAGPILLNNTRHEVSCAGFPLELSALEFNLLETFLRHPGQALTREQLLSQVWGYDYPGNTRTVDSSVKRLRAKLQQALPDAHNPIQTLRGVGYRLVASDPDAGR